MNSNSEPKKPSLSQDSNPVCMVRMPFLYHLRHHHCPKTWAMFLITELPRNVEAGVSVGKALNSSFLKSNQLSLDKLRTFNFVQKKLAFLFVVTWLKKFHFLLRERHYLSPKNTSCYENKIRVLKLVQGCLDGLSLKLAWESDPNKELLYPISLLMLYLEK